MSAKRLEEIARGLTGRECYVMLSSDFPDFDGGCVGGRYSPNLDLLAKSRLAVAGRWQGRRPAIFINDQHIGGRFEVLAILCHEAGHLMDMGFSGREESEVPEVALQYARNVQARSMKEPVVPVVYDELHSARFARATIHLWRRLQTQQRGLWCPPEWLWEGSYYGIPSPIEVIRALDDEPERLAKLPVSLILDLPSTPQFEALFVKE